MNTRRVVTMIVKHYSLSPGTAAQVDYLLQIYVEFDLKDQPFESADVSINCWAKAIDVFADRVSFNGLHSPKLEACLFKYIWYFGIETKSFPNYLRLNSTGGMILSEPIHSKKRQDLTKLQLQLQQANYGCARPDTDKWVEIVAVQEETDSLRWTLSTLR